MTEDELRYLIEKGVFESRLPIRTSEERRAYRAQEAELKQLFRVNLAQLHGLQGHPKEPLLFDIAWDHGHSAGYVEVLQYYDQFADLVKP